MPAHPITLTNNSCNLKKYIVIFDRGYPSTELITYLEENKIKYLMRVQKRFNKNIDSTKKSVFLTIVDCKVRVIKLTLNSGEEEVLITNLIKNSFIQCEFKELYSLRWGIETKYRTIKEKLDLENFSPSRFLCRLYMLNAASCLAIESDILIAKERTTKNWKHSYKTNENCLIGLRKSDFFTFLSVVIVTDERFFY